MNISVICACKDRNEALQVSLSSWLNCEQIKEIIIVDWSSKNSLEYLTKLDERIKIVRVNNKKYFNQPQPLNLAASLTAGDYILKLDCDYVINPYFNFIEAYFPGEDGFTTGVHNFDSPEFVNEFGNVMVDYTKMSFDEVRTYVDSYSPYFKYLTGLLFISKKNFLKIGGYNENLHKCYAYEDDEIYQRLRLLDLKEKKIDVDHNLIHIPHPDKKRLENFEGFELQNNYCEQVKNNLSAHYQGQELQWQVEYALAQQHIEENKKMIGKIDNYYAKPQTQWSVEEVSKNVYEAKEVLKNNKLNEFPSVYYLSLEESQDRRDLLHKQFERYNILPQALISKRFSQSNDKVTGKYLYQLNEGTTGCAVSHLKAIKNWYETTDEDYVFICEDDLSLETAEYWDFTWEEFITSLPDDAECVQLLTIRKDYDTFELRERYWDDWAATAYILTRDYAKKLIDTFIDGDTYKLEIPNYDIMPLIENILFASVGKTYTIPLFVENTSFKSTFENQDNDVNDGQKTNHEIANTLVLNYWKNKTNTKTEIERLLTELSLDTENPEHNFNIALWYEKEGHTAPALSYYLRCAERAEDKHLAYEALIRGSYCYAKQGERDGSSRGMLFQAQAFFPERPEAYFLLSRYAERREWWQDCYINADLALKYCSFDHPPLRTDVEYPGKYGLLFEKALAGWSWGKSAEARNLLTEILTDYSLTDDARKIVCDNLIKMGGKIPESQNFEYSPDFSWEGLTYEDIITIQREIVNEKVYRFWRDVKTNDVVVDIGASVGAYAISILEQNPRRVYCVEPSKQLMNVLKANCSKYLNHIVPVNKGIVQNEGDDINIFGQERDFEGITFKQLIEDYRIQYINYLKIDCEGGEYNIFTKENMNYLLNHVDFIAMEVHLNYKGCREKFKNFRDHYLTQFKNYKVMSCTRQNISWGTSLDIKNNIFDDEFIDNYNCEFMIYICNQ